MLYQEHLLIHYIAIYTKHFFVFEGHLIRALLNSLNGCASTKMECMREHAPIGLKCALLDPACQYASFGTLESEIGHTVMEISTYLALVYIRRMDDG